MRGRQAAIQEPCMVRGSEGQAYPGSINSVYMHMSMEQMLYVRSVYIVAKLHL